MVSYISKPVLKAVPHFGKINFNTLLSYTPNLILWGGASFAGILVFAEGVPIFQSTFYQKIPFVGSHWIKNPDPQDVPN